MRRRSFITLLGCAAASWPLAARAQQLSMPVVAFLAVGSPDGFTERVRAFRQGLKEAGFIEGENVGIEYRWAENQLDRLPALAADLVRKRVTVIFANGGTAPAIAAKAATTTIPIVFAIPEDPVSLGLVASLSRPGANLTGVNFFFGELVPKRLELLRELVPALMQVAVFVNPANPSRAEFLAREAESAGRAMGMQIRVFNTGTVREINTAFTSLASQRPDALLVTPDPFFNGRRAQIATLAARLGVPTSFPARDYVEAGGLMSYGPNINDAFHQAGAYIGRVLKGAKVADLPVVQSAKFELVINAQTARMLGFTVPDKLLVAADEVIE
jgi:putative ABC transport system substrate-binding protein